MIIPREIDFDDWFRNLIIDFPNDNIPIMSDNMSWREIGNLLIQENSFSSQGAPSTELFDDRMEWAMAVFKTMANYA